MSNKKFEKAIANMCREQLDAHENRFKKVLLDTVISYFERSTTEDQQNQLRIDLENTIDKLKSIPPKKRNKRYNGYLLWAAEEGRPNVAKLIKDGCPVSFGDRQKILSKEWKAFSAEERDTWIAKANAEKEISKKPTQQSANDKCAECGHDRACHDGPFAEDDGDVVEHDFVEPGSKQIPDKELRQIIANVLIGK